MLTKKDDSIDPVSKIANVFVAAENPLREKIEGILTDAGHNVVVKSVPGPGEAILILKRLFAGKVIAGVIEGTPCDPAGPYMAGILRVHFRGKGKELTIISVSPFPELLCRWGNINLRSDKIEELGGIATNLALRKALRDIKKPSLLVRILEMFVRF